MLCPEFKGLDMAVRLLRSTFTVSMMTMLSRVLGFVRDVVLAMIFGAGPEFDAFVIAFKIPNFLRRLFGEGAFAQAFVPVLAHYQKNKSAHEMRQFIDHIAGTLGLVLTVVVILAEIGAPVLVMIFAPGFLHDPVRFHLAQHMLRVTFPYLLFIALTAFSGATLNTFGRFAIPAFTPVILNVVLIAAACFWAPHSAEPIYTIAWGVMAGGVLQLAVQLPFLKAINLFPRPRPNFHDAGVRRVLKLMMPALFGVSVAQMSLLVDNFFASFLPKGSISWLYYSDRLTYLPLGVIGVAIATVVLPSLSRQHSAQNTKHYSLTVDWALRMVLLIGLPCAIGLFVLAGPILVTLIHHGAFNQFDVIMTRESLMAFSVGLPSFMLIKVLASGFYSKQNIKTPVKVAAVAMLLNLVLNLLLIVPLKHAGLALATSLAAWFNTGCLLVLLIKKGYYLPQTKWLDWMVRLGGANAIMVLVAWLVSPKLSVWFSMSVWQTIWHLMISIIGAVATYLLMLFLLGFRMRDIRSPNLEQS